MTSKIDSFKPDKIKLNDSFSQDNGTTNYEAMGTVYFAFIDVLGFKNAYEGLYTTKQGKIIEENNPTIKYRNVFNHYFEIMNAVRFINEDKETYAGQTSDSLYFYTKNIEFLVAFLNVFTLFNQYAMTQNVFFRGGVAQGELFRKEKHQFYGDSVIKAYLLESIVAQNPVIYIDHKTANDIYRFLEKNAICSRQESVVFEDIDKQRYYLKPFYKPRAEDYRVYLTEEMDFGPVNFTDIQIVLKKNKEDFEYHPKTFNKYTFLERELSNVLKL